MSHLTDLLAQEVIAYRDQAVAAAELEAGHKAARARRFLKAMHDGDAKSAVMAENIAEADETVADLYSKRLIAAALADASRQRILSLREAIGMERTERATERELDKLHSVGGT